MEVIAGDANQDLGPSGIDGDGFVDCCGQRSTAFCVDEDRDQLVTRLQRPFDHDVTFGDEDSCHVTVGKLTLLPEDVVPETLEDVESTVVRIIDGNPVGEQTTSRTGRRRDQLTR